MGCFLFYDILRGAAVVDAEKGLSTACPRNLIIFFYSYLLYVKMDQKSRA